MCVLYPALLRNVFVQLAVDEHYRARWSDHIHAEWMRALRRDRPDVTRDQVERIRVLMDRALPEALVQGYEDRIEDVVLPDPDDRHVVAAAVHGGASFIVTSNLRDFPADSLAEYGIAAVHPDDFLLIMLEADRRSTLASLRTVRRRLRRPPLGPTEFIERLARQGLERAAHRLRSLTAGI